MARKKKEKRKEMEVEVEVETTETGNCYVIEIGLDSNVTPRSDGTYPYLMCLVKVDNFEKFDHPKPAWFTQLNPDDQFVFRVFNYGVTGVGLTDIFFNSLTARFLATDSPKNAASITDEDMICTGKAYYPESEQATPSCAREGAYGWRLLGENGQEKSYTFTKRGKARLYVSVAATFPNSEVTELRWYTHDPEIFVGEGGPIHDSYRSSELKRRR